MGKKIKLMGKNFYNKKKMIKIQFPYIYQGDTVN